MKKIYNQPIVEVAALDMATSLCQVASPTGNTLWPDYEEIVPSGSEGR